jgi:rubrerythrin
MTRGAFMLRGALAAAAVSGAGAAGPFVTRALAQSDASDAATLDFALRLEALEAGFYDAALKEVPDMSAETRRIVQTLERHEHEHRRVIAQTILQFGIKNSPPPELDFGDAFTSEARFLEVAQELEDTGVAAYNGALPMLFAREVMRVAAAIVNIEARHAAVIRGLRGEPVSPAAFEVPQKPEQVAEKIRPYVQ